LKDIQIILENWVVKVESIVWQSFKNRIGSNPHKHATYLQLATTVEKTFYTSISLGSDFYLPSPIFSIFRKSSIVSSKLKVGYLQYKRRN
jgi:hypothetical protein